jgi:hypothetical protein
MAQKDDRRHDKMDIGIQNNGQACDHVPKSTVKSPLHQLDILLIKRVLQLVEALRYKPKGRGFDS